MFLMKMLQKSKKPELVLLQKSASRFPLYRWTHRVRTFVTFFKRRKKPFNEASLFQANRDDILQRYEVLFNRTSDGHHNTSFSKQKAIRHADIFAKGFRAIRAADGFLYWKLVTLKPEDPWLDPSVYPVTDMAPICITGQSAFTGLFVTGAEYPQKDRFGNSRLVPAESNVPAPAPDYQIIIREGDCVMLSLMAASDIYVAETVLIAKKSPRIKPQVGSAKLQLDLR